MTTSKMIRGVLKLPGQPATVHSVPDGLKGLQDVVGGLIDAPYMPGLNERGVTMWINDEGKCLSLDPNFPIYDGQDFVVGPAFFTGHDDEGETVSLTTVQERATLAWLATLPVLIAVRLDD